VLRYGAKVGPETSSESESCGGAADAGDPSITGTTVAVPTDVMKDRRVILTFLAIRILSCVNCHVTVTAAASLSDSKLPP
jgi:hypothetical protein